MTFERLDAFAALDRRVGGVPGRRELPHLDSLVQATTDQVSSVGRESHGVNTVLVAIRSLKTLQKIPSVDVPDTYTLVQRAGGNVLGIGGNGDGGDSILNTESHQRPTRFDIPQAYCPITTARRDNTAISREIKRVDILLVTREGVADCSLLDVPDTNEFVFGTGGEVLAVGAEADTPDIQIAGNVGVLVLQHAHLLAGVDIVDLRRSVTSSCHVFAVMAETDAAHDALVFESVHKVHIQHARDLLVEDDKPVVACLLDMRRQTVRIEIPQSIVHDWAWVGRHWASMIRCRVVLDLRGGTRARIRHRCVDLRGCGTSRWSPERALGTRSGTSGALRWLSGETVWGRSLLVRLCERRLLRRRRRWGRRPLKTWGRLHLVRWPWRCLLLLGRRLRWEASLATSSHDTRKEVVAGPDRRRRRAMLGRAGHALLGRASTGLV